MKIIVVGSRNLALSHDCLNSLLCAIEDIRGTSIKEIVSGGAQGIDSLAKAFATECVKLPFKECLADWSTHGKAAGPIRNRQMALYGDVLLAIWDGKSRGTANMIAEMGRLNKPVYTFKLDERGELNK